jgi:GDP/UDP-N,N'-diacetylbacillosamine 2-epimerase (hydrolysing)
MKTKKSKENTCIYISGSRSDYGLMKNTLKKLDEKFNIEFIVTGMHLSSQHGKTIVEIQKDGFKISEKIKVEIENDSMVDMSNGIYQVIQSLNKYFKNNQPKFTIILGDRWEALAGAIASAYNQIPICHISGGDISGGIDNQNRLAISSFATWHFVEHSLHKKHLELSGIDKKKIFVVGYPGMDQIVNHDYPNHQTVCKKFGIDFRKKKIIMVFHSTYEEMNNVEKYSKILLKEISKLGKSFEKIIIYPNSDAGGKKIIQTISKLKKDETFHVFKNLPHDEFLSLMSKTDLMIGNSSSALTEGIGFKIPAINVGVRQNNRIRGKNIIDCDYNSKKIESSIKKALSKNFSKSIKSSTNPYGNGKTAEKIFKKINCIFVDTKKKGKIKH